MKEIKVLTCKVKGSKIILEFQPEFMPGDKVYSQYRFREETLDSVEYDIRIKSYEGSPLEAKVQYGHNFYTDKHSQVSYCNSIAKTKIDAARLWFNDKRCMLGLDGYPNRYKCIIAHFKDNPQLLKEAEKNLQKIIKEDREERKTRAIEKIMEASRELSKLEEV